MNASDDACPKRRYYLDHLRLFLILVVFFGHCLAPFIAEAHWHVSNAESSFVAAAILGFIYQWAMPLFFLASGASAGFSLRHRSATQFVRERFLRIGIPLVAGAIFLGPFQLYFQDVQRGEFQGTLFEYYVMFYRHVRADRGISPGMDLLHLWFLRNLLEYSVIALPLFLFLLSDRGKRWTEKGVGVLENGWALLLLFIPIACVQMALRARFPEHEGWSNYVCWLVLFMYGYLLTLDSRLERSIARRGLAALVLGLACFVALGAVYFAGFGEEFELRPTYTAGFLSYAALSSLNTCCWTFFFLSVAIRRFDFTTGWLGPANELILPFYILHHAVIIAVGFYVVQIDAGILLKYVLLSIPSLLVTVFLCKYVVRPLPVLRPLFGLEFRAKAR